MKDKLTALGLIILLALLAGCGANRRVEVSAGDYVPVRNANTPDDTSAIETVRVYRENQIAWFALTDGTQNIVPFSVRGKAAWPTGCPTNINATRMEVLELETEALVIASTTFENPVLVRNCPPEPEEIVLRSDGEIGGGGNACIGATVCVPFERAPVAISLPHSMKGYELYSWHGEGEDDWVYILVTGTNRSKSYAELAMFESVVTEDDWVVITAKGANALKSALNLLLEGETVLWRDAGQLEGTPVIEVAFPGRNVVREIERYCQRRGIDLVIVD